MSDDKLIEWLLPFSMEELLDLESKLKNKIRSLERERAREAARQKKAAEAERLKREAEIQAAETERQNREAEEQARRQAEAETRRQAEEETRRREEAERQAAAKKPRPLPTNLYASVDQLAANQGLDISGLMSEIAKKTAKKPAPPGKGGNGRR